MTHRELTQMVLAGSGIAAIAAFLDGLSHDQRLAQVQGSPRKIQPLLFDAAAASRPLTLQDFVSDDTPAGTAVVMHGWNNLPMPAFGRRFKKSMVRHPDYPQQLFGYNDSPFTPLIGPGYFIHVATEAQTDWASRGGTVIDYFRVPDHDVPDHWPRVRPNSRGLQFFVYNKTRDFMRRVSDHVSVGAAYKKNKRIGAYFMLMRQDG